MASPLNTLVEQREVKTPTSLRVTQSVRIMLNKEFEITGCYTYRSVNFRNHDISSPQGRNTLSIIFIDFPNTFDMDFFIITTSDWLNFIQRTGKDMRNILRYAVREGVKQLIGEQRMKK